MKELPQKSKRPTFFFTHRGAEVIVPKPTKNKLAISRA
jgi:hypothetical protein